jgi:hypothetical protein
MSLLGTDAYRFALASALTSAQTSLCLISAYITVPGITWVLDRLNPSVNSCRVLARWNCSDLVTGASDLEVYELLRARNARFFVLSDLHAKVAVIDNKDLLVSSTNITRNGLRLVPGGNREIGIRLAASTEDVMIVDTMFDEAVEVTTDLYDEFRKNVETLKLLNTTTKRPQWPIEFSQKLERGPQRLWVTELLWCESPNALSIMPGTDSNQEIAVKHDLTLLGFDEESLNKIEVDDLRTRFLESRAWRWLITRLTESDSGELYFGRLSATLHNALLDDPKPYRQDVKLLVANLVCWAEEFGYPSITVDRPNYSQRLRLTS